MSRKAEPQRAKKRIQAKKEKVLDLACRLSDADLVSRLNDETQATRRKCKQEFEERMHEVRATATSAAWTDWLQSVQPEIASHNEKKGFRKACEEFMRLGQKEFTVVAQKQMGYSFKKKISETPARRQRDSF